MQEIAREELEEQMLHLSWIQCAACSDCFNYCTRAAVAGSSQDERKPCTLCIISFMLAVNATPEVGYSS